LELAYSFVKVHSLEDLLKLLFTLHEKQKPFSCIYIQIPFSGLVLETAGEFSLQVNYFYSQIPLYLHVFFPAPVAIYLLVFIQSHSHCFLTRFAEKTKKIQDVSFLLELNALRSKL
jgi:hypothetical protein